MQIWLESHSNIEKNRVSERKRNSEHRNDQKKHINETNLKSRYNIYRNNCKFETSIYVYISCTVYNTLGLNEKNRTEDG